jgi:proteasome accessory factor C
MSTGATERLSRLLALVPYLVSRQGVPLSAAAAEFGITEGQLVKDLELLFVCGTPGHLPDDLIDVDWDDGHVFLTNADPIARPLRLGVD